MGPQIYRNREGVIKERGEHLWPLRSELKVGSALHGSERLQLQPNLIQFSDCFIVLAVQCI